MVDETWQRPPPYSGLVSSPLITSSSRQPWAPSTGPSRAVKENSSPWGMIVLLKMSMPTPML